MEGTGLLMWGMVFGSIGFGMFVYGKRERAPIPLLCGIGLSAVPYVIPNVYGLVAAGTFLVVLPVFVKW